MADQNQSQNTIQLLDNNPQLAGFNASEWAGGGYADDADLRITKARLVPFDWYNKSPKYSLFLRVWYEPIRDSVGIVQPFDALYNFSNLDSFCPTQDGRTPCGTTADEYALLSKGESSIEMVADGGNLKHAPEQYQGYAALKIGTRETPDGNSDAKQYIVEMVEAGYKEAEMYQDVRFLEGLEGHFNQLKQKRKSKAKETTEVAEGGDKPEERKVLCLTHLYEKGYAVRGGTKGASTGSTTGSTTGTNGKTNGSVEAAGVAGSGTGDSFLSDTRELVIGLVAEKPLTWTDLRKELLKAVPKDKHAQLVKLMNGKDLKEGGDYVYDSTRNMVGLDQESIDSVAG